MPTTKRLVLDLPEDAAISIEARVRAGEYASADALVAAAVAGLDADAPPPGVSTTEWEAFASGVRLTARRVDGGEERTFASAEVQRFLADQRAARAAAR